MLRSYSLYLHMGSKRYCQELQFPALKMSLAKEIVERFGPNPYPEMAEFFRLSLSRSHNLRWFSNVCDLEERFEFWSEFGSFMSFRTVIYRILEIILMTENVVNTDVVLQFELGPEECLLDSMSLSSNV